MHHGYINHRKIIYKPEKQVDKEIFSTPNSTHSSAHISSSTNKPILSRVCSQRL